MFHSRGDADTFRRLADDGSDEEENISSKWEEPVTTSQHNSVTPKQTSDNIKIGNKRPLSNQASYLNALLEYLVGVYSMNRHSLN